MNDIDDSKNNAGKYGDRFVCKNFSGIYGNEVEFIVLQFKCFILESFKSSYDDKMLFRHRDRIFEVSFHYKDNNKNKEKIRINCI